MQVAQIRFYTKCTIEYQLKRQFFYARNAMGCPAVDSPRVSVLVGDKNMILPQIIQKRT